MRDDKFDRAINRALLGVVLWPAYATLLFMAADWLRYGGV